MAVMCATLLGDNGHRCVLRGREKAVRHLRQHRESPQMPGVPLPPGTEAAVGWDGKAFDGCDVVVIAVPCAHVRTALDELRDHLAGGTVPVVCCAKGIDPDGGRRMSELIDDAWPGHGGKVTLSGPNIAVEVAARKPSGAVLACDDARLAERARQCFATDYFRPYTSCDVVGVELAGAMKNVIAIAAGIVDGLGLGTNAKASLVTRGLVEMTRLGVRLGARPETFAGLAGMGDLMTTSFSPFGRNRGLGELIGKGRSLEVAMEELGQTCEGVPTTRALLDLASRHGVDLPIASSVAGVLFESVNPSRALSELMSREPKPETAGVR